MRTGRFTRGMRVALVVVLSVGVLPFWGGTAAADDFAPAITSLQRTSPLTLGSAGLIQIEFSAQDEGAAGLAYAMFTFSTPLGAEIRVDSPWMSRAPNGTFIASRSVGVWAASGSYRLLKAEVSDREWNSTVYTRGEAHGLALEQLDFEVDNPLQDTTAPSVSSAHLFQAEVAQGTPAVALYDAADDLSGVDRVTLMYHGPTGIQVNLDSLPGLGAVGPATWLSSLDSPSGSYNFVGLWVWDRAGNSTLYQTDRTYVYPPMAQPSGEVDPPTDHLDFTIVGSSGDRDAPRLTSFSPILPRERALGDQIGFDYSAEEVGTSGIWQIAAQWQDGNGHTIDASDTCGDVSKGPLVGEIEDYRTLGSEWKLTSVSIGDYVYNQASYFRDGTVLYQGDQGPPTHNFDFSAADFVIEDRPPSSHDLPRSSWCPRIADVTLDVAPAAAWGDLVDALGDVSIGGVPIPDPVVALHRYQNGEPSLLAVTEGSGDGKYGSKIVAADGSTVVATFLGRSGVVGAGISASQAVPIAVGEDPPSEQPGEPGSQPDGSIPVTVTAQFDRNRFRVRDRVRLAVNVRPFAEGAPVLLQRKRNSGWETMRFKLLSATGKATFAWTLFGTGPHTYRAKVRQQGSLAAAKSEPITIRVVRR